MMGAVERGPLGPTRAWRRAVIPLTLLLATLLVTSPVAAIPDSWVSRSAIPGVMAAGASLAKGGPDAIYALQSGATPFFHRYTPSLNAWATLRNFPFGVADGATLVYPGNRGDYLYATRGSFTTFYRYNIVHDTWTLLASAPGVIGAGASAVWAGDDTIYVHQGGGASSFYRYDIRANAWTTVAGDGYARGTGSSLCWPGGDSIYSIVGNGDRRFHVFNRSTASWATAGLESVPVLPGSGAALIGSGVDTLYFLAGGGDTRFFRYRVIANTWDTVTGLPSAASVGAALATTWDGETYIYAAAGNSTNFYRYELPDSQVSNYGSFASSITMPPGVRVGDSVTAVVLDQDEDRTSNAGDEAVFVLVSNMRTGESEVLRLFEEGPVLTKKFGGMDTIPLETNALTQVSGDGRLFALAGDTIRVLYVDPTEPSDTVAGYVIPFHDSVLSAVFHAPNFAGVGDSLSALVILDTDQNFRGTISETVRVAATNNRTGESEAWVLTENAANGGYFGLPADSLTLTVNAAFAATSDGRLYALAGDTITVRYWDPSGGADTIATGLITAYHDSGPSAIIQATSGTLYFSDSVYGVARDSDQNFNAFAVETVVLQVANLRTGEFETRVVLEASANAGYFGSIAETFVLSPSTAFSATGDGRLYALPGDSLVIRYIDPTQGTDSAISAVFTVRADTTYATCTFAAQVKIGDSITAIVIDTDRNLAGTVRETVPLLAINLRTNEQETFTLVEKSVNAGYFGGAITDTLRIVNDVTFAGSNDGRLFVLAGDTIRMVYTDPFDRTDSVFSVILVAFHDSAPSQLTSPGNRQITDSLTVIVRDSDQNFDAFRVETVTVEFRNNRTGETEEIILAEVSAGAGYFGGLETVALSTYPVDSAPGDDSLYVLTGDTIRILYADPTDGGDTAFVTVTVVPAPTASFLFDSPARVRLGDSVTTFLRDTDQNIYGLQIETVAVQLWNVRTNEQETWTLTENAVNAGYFGLAGETMGTTLNKALSGSGNGTLYALAGDSIRIRYTDPDMTSDSQMSPIFTAYHETVASAFTVVPAWAVVGDSLFGAVLRDTDQDFRGTIRETVTVTIIHQRTGETETWTLTEDTPTSAHFGSSGDSFRIRQDATFSASGDSTLYAVAGDTVRLLYTDPTDPSDTTLSTLVTVRHDTSASLFATAPVSAKIADSVTAIVRDTDENRSGLRLETVSVIFTNERTGETEAATLTEVGVNGGYFGGGSTFGETIPVTNDAAQAGSGNGRLFALAADTIRVRYTDRDDPTDTLASTLFAAYHDTGASAITHPASARLGESLTAIVRDTDQNFTGLGIETVAVILTNNQTGETERLVLTERGANGGYFGGADTIPVDTDATTSASGSGRLHALAGDTITILYTDPTGSSDTAATALIAAYHETGVSSIVWFPGTIVLSDSVGFALLDTDQNFFGRRVETVSVTVRNNRSLETEILILSERGANGGYFGGNDTLPLSSLLADNGSLSGKLYVLVGDTLNVAYADPSGGVDTLAVTITVVPDPTPAAVHFLTPSAKLYDSIVVTIRDTDQNFSGTRLETVPVTFRNERTGETEAVVLNENGQNGGYFGLATDTLGVTMDIAWNASGNGRLFALAGDTIVARYTDPNDLSDTLASTAIQAFHDSVTSAIVFMPTIARIYDSISVIIRDTDQNFQGLRVETIAVVVTNNRTGETEVLVLTETIANAGYFGGNDTLAIVIDTTFSGSGNGQLYASAGDTLTIRYTDPTHPADTLISPTFIGVYHDSAPAAFILQPSVRLYDSVTAIVHDSDQNLWGLYQETVLVSFRNTRTNELETRVIAEVGVNAGYFGGTETRAVTMDITYAATGNGVLFMLAGDTLLVTYQDPTFPTDSVTSGPIQAYHDTVFATILYHSPSAKLYDSVTMRVRDTDQNFFGTRVETVPFSLINLVTGEIDTFVLTESGANAGYWGLPTDTAWVTMDAFYGADGDGRLYALAADTILLRYHDPSGPPDSVVSTAITAFHDSVPSAWTFYPPAVEIYDSFRVIVRDTDQNLNGRRLETVSVTFTVTRTGETETLVIREPNNNAGYFGIQDTLPVTIDATWIASGNGRLHVLAGDTVRVVYRDPTDTTDTIFTPFIGIYHDTVAATWVVPTVTRYDDSVIAYIRDTDQNFYGTEVETVWVTVINNRTGEIETLVLRESGANGGYFGQPGDTLPVTRLVVDAPSGSGRLFALGGDSLTIRYVDPSDPTDSLTATIDLVSWFIGSEPLGAGLGLYTGALEWADYDRDGDPDLAVAGLDHTAAARLAIIRNDGFGVFSVASQPMGAGFGFRASSLDWGDYDNDGDPDLVVSGHDNTNRRLVVFRNDAGTFNAAVEPMGANQGVDAGSVQWGDYDNDGDLDLMVMGVDNASRKRLILFRNDTGVFVPDIEPFGAEAGVSAGVAGATAARLGDYDNDGNLDIVVAGQDNIGFTRRFVIFRNVRNETYVAAAQPFGTADGFLDASFDWGDYDGDGDLDLLAAGSATLGANPRLLVYRNDGNSVFTAVAEPVGAGTGYSYPSVRWVDLDNDGDLDFLASGLDTGGIRRFRAFRNNGGASWAPHTEIMGQGLGVAYGAHAWADWDRDGDIDIAMLGQDSTAPRLIVYLDVVGYLVNVAPTAPAPVTANGRVFGSDTVVLSWSAPTGDTTPAAALTYDLRVGRTSQGVEVMSGDTYPGDTVAGRILGNVQNGETATLYIRNPGTYTWSVRALDGGQAGSAWSAERTFVINASISEGAFPAQARENDSMSALIIDTDQNFSAVLQETVPVLVTNIRTSESEVLVLREIGTNSSRFGGSDTLPLTIDVGWAASGNGRLHALAGDTLIVYYHDPDNARDSVTSAQILVRPDTTISVGVYPPNLRVGDSATATIRDSDENRSGILVETVTVTIRNNRTGETEALVLTERGVNAGYFGGLDTLPLTIDATWAASGNGRLLALTGDTISIHYVDANNGADTLQSPDITILPDTTLSVGVFPPRLRVGDSVTAFLRDTDENRSGIRSETVAVTVTNLRTGETERLVITERGANAGYFGGLDTLPITIDSTWSPPGDGRLVVLAGDTVSISYRDPDDPADTLLSTPITAYPDSTISTAQYPPALRTSDSFTLIVRDTDRSFSGVGIETVAVLVTNLRSGETEYLDLRENGANAGYFGGMETLPLTLDPSYSGFGNGRILVLPGDSIQATYQDPRDPTDSFTSPSFTVRPDTAASAGTFPPHLLFGDSLTAFVRDSDQNSAWWLTETVSVTARNNRSGETEILVLRERGANGGYFGGADTIPLTLDATWAASGDGRLVAWAGDSVTITYADPTDATDSVASSNLVVLPVATASAGVYPPGLRVGDSLTAFIRDTDQNFHGTRRETIAIIVTHLRTGETERLVLGESTANAGYFGGTDTLPLTLDAGFAASADGRFFAVAGDTLTFTYTDPDDGTDSLSGPFYILRHETTAASGTFPPSLRVDDSVTAVIRDTDQNLSGLRSETVTLVVVNNRSNEQETVTLTENAANAGYFGGGRSFGDTLPLTSDAAYVASGNGRLYALAGDTVTIRYRDPRTLSDSISVTMAVVFPETSSSSLTVPTSLRTGDSVSAVVRDSDRNLQGTVVETVAVTVTNGRTGESETLVLWENLANSGYFGGSDTLPLSGDAGFAPSGNGRMFALAGDTITVRYADPGNAADSVTSGAILVLPETTSAAGTFPPYLYTQDSVTALIRDSDQNFLGLALETVAVWAFNSRTGDSERLTLGERGANAGYFGGVETLPITMDATWAAALDGRLHARPGDTVVLRYDDPTDARDSAWSSPILVLPETTAAFGVFPPALRTGDSLTALIRDSDQNLDARVAETVAVVALNGRTLEAETLVLGEKGANSGYFGGSETLPLVGDAAHAATGTGRLFVLPGDTLTIRYVDPTHPADSAASGVFTILPDTTQATGFFPPTLRVGESVSAIILDSDQNRSGLVVESVTIVVVNMRTGETESWSGREHAAHSGYFGGADTLPLATAPADAASGTGRLVALAGDTLVVRYQDPRDARDSLVSSAITVSPVRAASGLFFPSSARPTDTFGGVVRDSDANRSGVLAETVTATIANVRTGEVETFTLRENGADAGYFGSVADSIALTADSSWSAPGNGRLAVLSGDSLVVAYVDRLDPADSARSTAIVVPDTTSASAVFPPILRVGDSATAVVRDSDRNRAGTVVETVAVTLRVGRTGEVETLVLRENGANGGYFGGTETMAFSSAAGDAGSGSGRLHVLAGDTVVISYVDPSVPADSVASPAITVVVETTASRLVVPISVATGETLAVTVLDPDQNLSAFQLDTVLVVVRNARTGETEAVTFRETDANAGLFAGGIVVTRSLADSLSGSGRIFALILDTIFVRYLDPTDGSDAVESGVTVRPSFTGSIQQIYVQAHRIGADTYRIHFIPTGALGETFPTLDGVPLTVSVRDSTGGLGRLTETVAYLSPESAPFLYTRVERVTLWFEVRVLGDSFYPSIVLVAAGDSVPTVVTGRRDTTGSEGVILVPSGYYDTSGYRILVEPFSDFTSETPSYFSLVDRANARSADRGDRRILPGAVRPEHQVNIYEVATARFLHALDTVVWITVTYPDGNHDGFVDGTTVSESSLGLYFLDENLGVWVLIPGTTTDIVRNRITGQVSHLTIFTLMGGASGATNASGVLVYPNPWRPNDGIADNGREYIPGDLTTGILFENLPAGARVRVLSILGELVMERHVGTGGTYQWDVRNQRGLPVASGQYMVVIEAPNGSRLVEKLTVIR